jgi:tetratricopeptide (TPR) repeat protein
LALPLFFLLSFVYACISLADVPHWRNDITLIRMEVKADPDYIPAQAGLAGLYQGKGRFEEARRQYDEALLPILFPNAQTVEERIARVRSPQMYRLLRSGSGLRYKPMELLNSGVRGSGGTHQALGQFEKAIADYRVALAAKPDDFEVRDYLALLYTRLGRYPQAEATIRETLTRAPSAGRYIQLAELLIRAGRWKEAQETLLEVTMQPDFAALPDTEKSRAMALNNELAKRLQPENIDR